MTVDNLTPRQAEHLLRAEVFKRARYSCEGSPKYPTCRAMADEEHPDTGKPTTLAIIRIEPGSSDPAQCRVLCSRCLLEYDFPRHQHKNWRDAREATRNLELFPIEAK